MTSPGAVHFVVAELVSASGYRDLARAAETILGGIDILVNVLGDSNAPGGGFAALDDDIWAREIGQNLMAAVRFDRALVHYH